MDEELVRHVAMTAFRSSANLNDLIPLLKSHCTDDECRYYLDAISAISFDIANKIVNKIYSEYPDIEHDVESRIEKYGQLISG